MTKDDFKLTKPLLSLKIKKKETFSGGRTHSDIFFKLSHRIFSENTTVTLFFQYIIPVNDILIYKHQWF